MEKKYTKRLELWNGIVSAEIVYEAENGKYLNAICKNFYFVLYRSNEKTYQIAKKWLDEQFKLINKYHQYNNYNHGK